MIILAILIGLWFLGLGWALCVLVGYIICRWQNDRNPELMKCFVFGLFGILVFAFFILITIATISSNWVSVTNWKASMVSFISGQPDYKIYKNVCHNESIPTGAYTFVHELIKCNYTEEWGGLSYFAKCINKSEFEEKCGNEESCWTDPRIPIYYERGYSEHQISVQKNIYKVSEVCGEVEVEKITEEVISKDWLNNCCTVIGGMALCIEVQEAQKGIDFVTFNSETIELKSCDSDLKKYINKVTLNKDINQKWLDENCLLFAYVDGRTGTDTYLTKDEFNQMYNDDWKNYSFYHKTIETSKWKCGEYTVK